jgi:integrase
MLWLPQSETKQPNGPDKCPEMQTDKKHRSWGYSLSYKSEPDPKRPGRQRRRQFRKSGYATKRAAEKARAELLTKLADGTHVEPSKTPMSPATLVDKPTVTDTGEKHWEPEQLAEFLRRCEHHRLGGLFEVAMLTGLRRGELTGLHWANIDFTKRMITVRHNRVSADGRVQDSTTKTKAGKR